MWIVDGAVTMTIGDETRELVADDVVVVNPGIEHELCRRCLVRVRHFRLDVRYRIDPVLGRFDPSVDTGVFGKKVEQVAAAEKLKRLTLCELE